MPRRDSVLLGDNPFVESPPTNTRIAPPLKGIDSTTPVSRTTLHQALPASGPTLLSIKHSGGNPAGCRPWETVSLDTQTNLDVEWNLLPPPPCYTAKAYLVPLSLPSWTKPLFLCHDSVSHSTSLERWAGNEALWHPVSPRLCPRPAV